MWPIKKAWYRTYQAVFRVLVCFLDWSEPERLEGPGAIKRLPALIQSKGVEKVLIVTDKGLMSLHLLDPLFEKLTEAGIQCKRVNRVSQSHPNILDMIQSGTVDLIINTPTKGRKQDSDGFKIRRSAVEHSVACVTAIDTARAVLTVREQSRSEDLTPIDITKI